MSTKRKLLIGLLVIGLPTIALGYGWMVRNDTGLAPESMRAELGESIVSRWTPYVEKTYGPSAAGWGDRLQDTINEVDISNLERAASADDFQSMSSQLLGGAPAIVAVAGKDGGAQTKAVTASNLVYTPINPCRIVDTRVVGGPLAGGETRSYAGYTATDFTSQGGFESNCGIPANAAALALSFTSVLPGGNGYFTAYPFNEAKPITTALNYSPGLITSGHSTVPQCRPSCSSQFNVYSHNQSHMVIDAEGYFTEPETVALDCTVAEQSGFLDLLGGVQTRTIACPAGYSATSGSCTGALGLTINSSEPNVVGGQPTGWKCDLVGSLLSGIAYKAQVTCCRVPGR
ncbi:hypothetical protein [Lysobacter sp. 22409]|uniref:hypothetical protein n=1 Tax=Lysobacter sp. 22409 TaxID=3453917 RepID=UPI003F82B322